MQSHPAERAAVASAVESNVHGAGISIDGIAKRFGNRTVLNQFNLAIRPGEFLAIVGRSGCGKSTLLRLLAGLDGVDEGDILLDGHPLHGIHADTRIMFQEARLLPWKRVLDNVLIGLPPERRAAATAVLAQVGLSDRANDWPAVLSGGQRQRVALARALVHAPHLLLLDEPLGALDALTRIEMHQLIESLWRAGQFTAVLVTHDVGEAIALADRVVLIEDGAITLDQVIDLPRPRHRGSARFAAIEERILDRVLATPSPPAAKEPNVPISFGELRWAI